MKQVDLKTLSVGQAVYIRYNDGYSRNSRYLTGEVTKISPTGQVSVKRHDREEVFRFKAEPYSLGNKGIGVPGGTRAYAHLVTGETYRAEIERQANEKAITEELDLIYDALDQLRVKTQPAVKHARSYGYRMSAAAHAEAVALVAEAAKLLAAHTPAKKED